MLLADIRSRMQFEIENGFDAAYLECGFIHLLHLNTYRGPKELLLYGVSLAVMQLPQGSPVFTHTSIRLSLNTPGMRVHSLFYHVQ
jgi:hypothetical protein